MEGNEDIIAQLKRLQEEELSIIRLSEPISIANAPSALNRESDVSSDAFENPSPASLAADLEHYKELFSKLRFSYLEQVTKEKFLRAIVGDPPQIIEHHENIELEAQLVTVKAELKAQKLAVASMVEELEAQGRELSTRYQIINLQMTQLSTLPDEISSLQSTISTLQAYQQPPSSNPLLRLPLSDTQARLSQRITDLDALNQQLKNLQQNIPRKARELERLEGELKPLELQKAGTVAAAREAKQRKQESESGTADELERKGRWYKSVEAGLTELLGLEGKVGA